MREEAISDEELRKYVIDPRTLTAAERRALERFHTEILSRVRGGYGRPGDTRIVSLDMTSRLMLRGLVHIIPYRNRRVVDTTTHGKETMRLMRERRRKK